MKNLRSAVLSIVLAAVMAFDVIAATARIPQDRDVAEESPASDPRKEVLNRALSAASFNGDMKGVKDLISLGADVNRHLEGEMPLMGAVISGQTEIVKVLIDSGADVNLHTKAQWSRKMTPLMMAVSMGHADIVKLLIKAGAEPSAKDEHGITPLMRLPFMSETEYSSVKYVDIINALLSAGANPNAAAERANPILMDAAVKGNEEAVRILLAAGADVNAVNESGETALMAASSIGSSKTVKLLLAAGAEANASDKTGGTALMNAALSGDAESVKLLLAAGAEANAKKISGATACLFAMACRHDRIVRILKNAGAQSLFSRKDQEKEEGFNDALLEAVSHGEFDKTAFILAAGADANAVDYSRDETALMKAARRGEDSFDDLAQSVFGRDFDVVRMLLAAGADVNERDKTGGTALMYAFHGVDYNIEIIKALIAAGADVNAKSDDGTTALLIDAGSNRYSLSTTKALLAAGADATVKDKEGNSPLTRYITKFSGSDSYFLTLKSLHNLWRIMEELLSAGAHQYLKTADGKAKLIEIADEFPNDEGIVIGIAKILATVGNDGDLEKTRIISEIVFSLPTKYSIANLAAESDWVLQRDEDGATVLIAITKSCPEDDEKNNIGYETEQYYCRRGVKALLAAGADLNAQDNDGLTALMIAVKKGNIEIAELLLESGADLKVKDVDGLTAFEHVDKEDAGMRKLLKSFESGSRNPNN